jgi:hypothetical protein
MKFKHAKKQEEQKAKRAARRVPAALPVIERG